MPFSASFSLSQTPLLASPIRCSKWACRCVKAVHEVEGL
ncbi:hypothetical protein V6Z11_A05G042100 [Gossypium hirsutum]